MPTYCYKSSDGERIERFYTKRDDESWMDWKGPPRMIRVKGKRFERDMDAELESQSSTPPGCWPQECFTAAVLPSQAKELSDFLKNAGVPTEVKPNGIPVLRDNDHRNKFLKARLMHDNDAGYRQHAGS